MRAEEAISTDAEQMGMLLNALSKERNTDPTGQRLAKLITRISNNMMMTCKRYTRGSPLYLWTNRL